MAASARTEIQILEPSKSSMPVAVGEGVVDDPFLLSILRTSASARDATAALSDLAERCVDDQQSLDESSPTPLDLSRAQKTLNAHLSRLRSQNRQLAHVIRDTKTQTAESRSEIDALHLSLQNLYYESRHLAGEISACEAFPHEYTQLPLVPEDEFLERFPEWQERDEEDLMKARIEKEYEERVELEEKRKALLAKKMELIKENAKRKEDLAKLDGDLEAFIDAAKPIQKTFEKEY